MKNNIKFTFLYKKKMKKIVSIILVFALVFNANFFDAMKEVYAGVESVIESTSGSAKDIKNEIENEKVVSDENALVTDLDVSDTM